VVSAAQKTVIFNNIILLIFIIYLHMFHRFAGNKSSMRDVADRFDITISTCETILSRVMSYLLSIAKDVIKFSNNDEEKGKLAYHFSKITF